MGAYITPTNHGPVVNIIQWIFMIVMTLATLIKVADRWQRMRYLMADDYLLSIAMIFAIGETVAVSEQVTFGLGKPTPLKNEVGYEKASYAGDALYVVALCFAKVATVFGIKALAPLHWMSKATAGLVSFIAVWTFASFVAVLAQCGGKEAWALMSNHCFHKLDFWAAYGSIDILTDLLLAIIPIIALHNLQTTVMRRASVIFTFTIRILTIPLIILRLCYISDTLHSEQVPFAAAKSSLVSSIQIDVAIVLACAPFIKTVIEHTQHGMMRGDRLQGPTTTANPRTSGLNTVSSLRGRTSRTGGAKPSARMSWPRPGSLGRLSEEEANLQEIGNQGSHRSARSSTPIREEREDSLQEDGIMVRTTIETSIENV